MSTRFRRRPVYRDLGTEASHVKRYEGTMHAAVLSSFKVEELDYMSLIVMLGLAYHQDILTAAGEAKVITYADDVAAITGIGVKRVQDMLSTLRRLGLTDGTAQAGYRLTLA